MSLSLFALMAATAIASAADLPEPAASAVGAHGLNWTGFYVGVHGAWISDTGEAERTGLAGVSPAALPTRAGLSSSGLGGGAQIGYLWQFDSVVAGLEADLTATDIGNSRSVEGFSSSFALRTDLSSQISWVGTVKGRVGITMPSLLPMVQQSLVYVTGGLAYAQVERQGRITVTPPGVGPQARSDEWATGFVVGGGTEHRLTESVSLKTETLYYKLADETLRLARAGDEVAYRLKNDGWISRAAINLRF